MLIFAYMCRLSSLHVGPTYVCTLYTLPYIYIYRPIFICLTIGLPTEKCAFILVMSIEQYSCIT